MPPRDKLYEVDLTNQLPHVTKLWMTSLVVIVVCLVRSSTPNCSGWTQNLVRKHQWFVWRVFLESWKQTYAIFKRWISCNGHLCYTVENSEVFTSKEKFFGVAFNRCLGETIFFCAGCLIFYRTARTSIYQRNAQELTNKRTAIKKTCLFSGCSKELHLT